MADDQRPSPLAVLYDEDFYVWSQDQAAAIRAAAKAGELPPTIDWERLADEVGDLGKSELNKMLSLAARIIEHLYLLETSRRPEPKPHWRKEIRAFRDDMMRQFTPTIRKMLAEEFDDLHRNAGKAMAAYLADVEPSAPPLDASRRWTLAEIAGEENDPIA